MTTRLEGSRLVLEGPVTADTVPRLLQAGDEFLRQGLAIVDFAAVSEVDSSAVALLLQWLRDASAGGRSLAFANLPPIMHNLARLYGVSDLIPEHA
jgi:phospholipid transport system transporter-binding protein